MQQAHGGSTTHTFTNVTSQELINHFLELLSNQNNSGPGIKFNCEIKLQEIKIQKAEVVVLNVRKQEQNPQQMEQIEKQKNANQQVFPSLQLDQQQVNSQNNIVVNQPNSYSLNLESVLFQESVVQSMNESRLFSSLHNDNPPIDFISKRQNQKKFTFKVQVDSKFQALALIHFFSIDQNQQSQLRIPGILGSNNPQPFEIKKNKRSAQTDYLEVQALFDSQIVYSISKVQSQIEDQIQAFKREIEVSSSPLDLDFSDFEALRNSQQMQKNIFDKFQVHYTFSYDFIKDNNYQLIFYGKRGEVEFDKVKNHFKSSQVFYFKMFLLTLTRGISVHWVKEKKEQMWLYERMAQMRMRVLKHKYQTQKQSNHNEITFEIVEIPTNRTLNNVQIKHGIIFQFRKQDVRGNQNDMKVKINNLKTYFKSQIFWILRSPTEIKCEQKFKYFERQEVKFHGNKFQDYNFLTQIDEFDTYITQIFNSNLKLQNLQLFVQGKDSLEISDFPTFLHFNLNRQNQEEIKIKIAHFHRLKIEKFKENKEKLTYAFFRLDRNKKVRHYSAAKNQKIDQNFNSNSLDEIMNQKINLNPILHEQRGNEYLNEESKFYQSPFEELSKRKKTQKNLQELPQEFQSFYKSLILPDNKKYIIEEVEQHQKDRKDWYGKKLFYFCVTFDMSSIPQLLSIKDKIRTKVFYIYHLPEEAFVKIIGVMPIYRIVQQQD